MDSISSAGECFDCSAESSEHRRVSAVITLNSNRPSYGLFIDTQEELFPSLLQHCCFTTRLANLWLVQHRLLLPLTRAILQSLGEMVESSGFPAPFLDQRLCSLLGGALGSPRCVWSSSVSIQHALQHCFVYRTVGSRTPGAAEYLLRMWHLHTVPVCYITLNGFPEEKAPCSGVARDSVNLEEEQIGKEKIHTRN